MSDRRSGPDGGSDGSGRWSDDLVRSESTLEGPEVYRARLFFDRDPATGTGSGEDAAEEAAARALWDRREERRLRYEGRFGQPDVWPAEHPTTVLDVADGPLPVRAAVCIRCDWLERSTDEEGVEVDLHAAAKEHALAHPHDPLLEEGVNPPRRVARVRGLREVFDEARANAMRAARRVAPRGQGQEQERGSGSDSGSDLLPEE